MGAWRRAAGVGATAVALAVSPLLAAGACSVGDLDDRGKACTDRCPSGLPCVQGICGGSLPSEASVVGGDVGRDAADDAAEDTTSEVPAPKTLTVTSSGTGKGAVRSADSFIDCPSRCSHAFARGDTVLLTASALADSAFVGWGQPCAGNGTCSIVLAADVTVDATFAATVLDVDGDRFYGSSTDATLISRYLFGTTGSALTQGAIGTNATRSTPEAILAYATSIREQLDIDGDGQKDALTDGLLIQRYMSGKRGSELTQDAVAAGATRDASQIEAYLKTLMPPPTP